MCVCVLLTQSWHKELFTTIASHGTQASSELDNLSHLSPTPPPSGISLYPSAALREKEKYPWEGVWDFGGIENPVLNWL